MKEYDDKAYELGVIFERVDHKVKQHTQLYWQRFMSFSVMSLCSLVFYLLTDIHPEFWFFLFICLIFIGLLNFSVYVSRNLGNFRQKQKICEDSGISLHEVTRVFNSRKTQKTQENKISHDHS